MPFFIGGAGCGSEAPAAVGADRAPTEDAAQDEAARLRVRVASVASRAVGGGGEVAVLTEPFRSATVAAEVGGRVVERHVEPGAAVAAGDPLVTLDAELLAIVADEARAALAARAADRSEARHELERGVELHRQGALSVQRLDGLRFTVERAESAHRLAAATLRRAERAHADAVVAPISLALGWGLVVSTLITLFLVPVLYTLAGDLRALRVAGLVASLRTLRPRSGGLALPEPARLDPGAAEPAGR